jgi:multiple sugar transport system permease protein
MHSWLKRGFFDGRGVQCSRCFLMMVVLPIYWMAITSFKTHTEIIDAQNLTYFPKTFTVENYDQLFSMYDYAQMLKNSLIVSVSTAVCITLLSILGGYAMARYTFRGKGAMLLFFLITQMIPGILVIIPLYLIYANLGLINTRFSLFVYYLIVNLPFWRDHDAQLL